MTEFGNLRALHAATTPGEYRAVDLAQYGHRPQWWVEANEEIGSSAIAAVVYPNEGIEAPWGEADAAFIAAAHNELPALLARLDEVTAENAALAAVVSSALGVVESYENWYEDWPEDSWRFERDIRAALNLTDKEENQ